MLVLVISSLTILLASVKGSRCMLIDLTLGLEWIISRSNNAAIRLLL